MRRTRFEAGADHEQRLEAGKRADFVVLDRDIFTIDPYGLHETQVKATYLDGREVYHSDRGL